jgi:hypothetical protein
MVNEASRSAGDHRSDTPTCAFNPRSDSNRRPPIRVASPPSIGSRPVSSTQARSAAPSTWSRPVLQVVPGGMTARMTVPAPLVVGRSGSYCRTAVPGGGRAGELRGPTEPAGSLAGRAGVGAVGLTLARPGRDRLAGSAADPGRPARAGHGGEPRQPHLGGGGGERGTVGALVASRRPHPRWAGCWSPSGCPGRLRLGLLLHPLGLVARPEPLPAAGDLAGSATLSQAGFVLLVTPTGTLPSPRRRRWARVQAAALVVALLSSGWPRCRCTPRTRRSGTRWASRPWPTGRWPPPSRRAPCSSCRAAGGAGSPLSRSGRARGLERLQLRWLVVGACWPRWRWWSP